ncbi:DUF4129 domain-containing protein [Virgibacillus doumboii]|uniref:DUF4129 domain-containing protein n=1 Tax=Virgibacillus doumboii TaxID=2697503 RepID=UPI0013E0CF54|nr:DUF4129 domain-containing protein [Virgibacillus doumboii]
MFVSSDKAREEIRGILDQNEYKVYYEDNRNFLQIWWERLTNWIGEQLTKLFSGLEPSSGFADLVLFTIIIAIIALIGFVVLHRFQAGKRRKFYDYQPLKSLNASSWSFADHLRAVRQQENDKNHNEAARHLFLATLLYFHDKEWLRAKNWKTNWEYYAELQRVNSQLADSFHQLALVFDEVVYGEQKLEIDDYYRFRNEAMQWLDEDSTEVSGEV